MLRHREDVRGADAYSPRRRRCRLSGFGDNEEEKQGDGRRRFAFDELPQNMCALRSFGLGHLRPSACVGSMALARA